MRLIAKLDLDSAKKNLKGKYGIVEHGWDYLKHNESNFVVFVY